jgi:hypothetical protein
MSIRGETPQWLPVTVCSTVGNWQFIIGRLSMHTWRNSAAREMHHEERIYPGNKGALPGVRGTRILRVAREPNGAEEVGAQRRLRHVPWDWQGSVILVGDWKERSFACRGSESEAPLALLIAPDGA